MWLIFCLSTLKVRMKDKIINFRYVFYPFLAFFLGITMARKLFAGSIEIVLVLVSLFAILTTFLLIKKLHKPLLVIFACFLLGNGFYFLGETSFSVKEYSSPVSVVGRISDNISDRGFYCDIVLDEVKIDGKKQANLRLTLKNAPQAVNVGDFVAFEGVVERSKPFTLGQFNSSDYRSGVRYCAEVSYSNVVFSSGYLKIDEKVRLAVKNQLYNHMSEKNAGISYAVLFGDKSGVDEATETAYQNSGIIHVLTVSGLHVGFLITLVYFLLKLCKANHLVRFIVTSIFIICYAFLCGFSPSVVRAGVMAIVLMLSKLFMRKYDSLNSLGMAGFAICLFSPLSALDLGFQMSFFCVCAIIMLEPVITRFLSKFVHKKIASLISLSISAQIGILPISAVFGASVNILSVFANLIIVPLFSIIYPFLFVISLLSTFIPYVGYLLSIADYAFIVVNALVNFFGNGSLSFKTSPFKTAIICVYFITLFGLGRFVMINPLKKFALFGMLFFVMVVAFGFYLIPQRPENSVSIIGNKTSSSVIITNKKRQTLVVGNSYLLDRFLSQRDVDYIDAYITLGFLGDQAREDLAEKGVYSFIVSENIGTDENFEILKNNIAYSFGDYNIKFISNEEELLGVNVNLGTENIFIASDAEIDYNNQYIKEISPNFIITQSGGEKSQQFISVSQYGKSDYSIARNGNMIFKLNKDHWIMRGLD